MTVKDRTVSDALIAKALAERASGPDVDLVSSIMTATRATRQRSSWIGRLGRPRRSAMLLLAAGALTASLVGAAIFGSNLLRPRSVDLPLPANGLVTAVGSGQIFEFDPQMGATPPRALASTPAGALVVRFDWSHDGARLAISTDTGVLIYDAVTGGTRRVVSCGYCEATWSPDGTGLTIVDEADRILLIDPDDGHTISSIDPIGGRGTEPDSAYPAHVRGVSWSPDGRRLAVSGSDVANSTAHLVVMDRDGSSVRPISLPTLGWPIVDASWSPDGSTIAYIGFGVADQNSSRSIELALIDPEGIRPSATFDIGECFCVGLSPSLAWSPDGRRIVFSSVIDNTARMFVANADGSDIQPTVVDLYGPLAWRPIPPPAPN